MNNYESDDLTSRYIGGREQDNEELDFQTDLTSAKQYDEEMMAKAIGEKAVEEAAPEVAPQTTEQAAQPQKGDEPTKTPDYALPSAEGVSGERPQVDPVVEDGLPSAGELDPDYETPTQEETTLQNVMNVTKQVVDNAPKNITMGIVRGAKHGVDAVAPGFLAASDKALEEMGMGEAVGAVNTFFDTDLKSLDPSDHVVQEMSGFMFHFGAYMKLLGGVTKAGAVTRGFAADAMASFLNIDPHMERLSSVAKEMGIENDLIDYMASEEGTDADNRLRNVLEGQILGGSLVAVAQTLKGTWWAAKALKKQSDEVGMDEFLFGKPEVREKGAIILSDAKDTGFEGTNFNEAAEWIEAKNKGFDMGDAARIDRAKSLGFDTEKIWHHGSAEQITEFDHGWAGTTTANNPNEVFYFTLDEGAAEDYSKEAFNRRYQDYPEGLVEDGIVKELPEFSGYSDQYGFVEDLANNQLKTHPSFIRHENPLVVDWEGGNLDHDRANAIVAYAKNGYDETGLIDDIIEGSGMRFDESDIKDYKDEIIERARDNFGLDADEDVEDYMFTQAADEVLSESSIEPTSFDSVIFENIIDDIGEGSAHPQTTLMVFDPSNIRSTEAAFDPSMSASGKLAAGVAGAAAIAVGSDEAQAGSFSQEMVNIIKRRQSRLDDPFGDGLPADEEKETPNDTRKDADIVDVLPDAIFMEWVETGEPIKEWLWKSYPEMLQSPTDGGA